jgi:hypothetical protein
MSVSTIADKAPVSRYGASMTGEERNPFGGFLFSGPDEALSRLAEAASSQGLKLIAVDAGDGIVRLCLPPEPSFGAACGALVNRAQAGEFGNVSLGIFGGAAPPPH